MRKLLQILVFFAMLSGAMAAKANDSIDDRFVDALVSGDAETARSLLSKDAKIAWVRDGVPNLIDLDILAFNIEGLKEIGEKEENGSRIFDMCDGVSNFLVQPFVENGEISLVYFGVIGFLPPPIMYRDRYKYPRCQPPVLIVTDL